jgi:hypothetical protein
MSAKTLSTRRPAKQSKRRSPRRFIAMILGIGTLVSSLSAAQPAAALDDSEKLRLFFGTAAAMLLLNELDKNQSGKKSGGYSAHTPPRHSYTPPRYQAPRGGQHPSWSGREYGHRQGRWQDQVLRRHNGGQRLAPVPMSCIRNSSKGKVLSPNCLENNYRSARPLPKACLINTRMNGKSRSAYLLSCISRQGYQIANR